MKTRVRLTFILIFLILQLIACSGSQTELLPTPRHTLRTSKISALSEATETPFVQNNSSQADSPTLTIIPTITPRSTTTPTEIFSTRNTETPFPTTIEQATIEAFGPLCPDTKDIKDVFISPDDRWIAAECYWLTGHDSSYLQVISQDRSKEWKIFYREYAKGDTYDRKDIIKPFHWSTDGRFLYAVASSKWEGCCWIGLRYVLLVRLNLETGEQIDLLNATDYNSSSPFDMVISDSDRYLIFTPPSYQPYDFAILDLLTWRTQTISVEFPDSIDIYYAVMSPDEGKIVMPLFEQVEFNDFRVTAIGLIDLVTGKQTLLISSLKQGEELYPVSWIDSEYVLLSHQKPGDWYNKPKDEYWSLNIYSSRLEKAQNQ